MYFLHLFLSISSFLHIYNYMNISSYNKITHVHMTHYNILFIFGQKLKEFKYDLNIQRYTTSSLLDS